MTRAEQLKTIDPDWNCPWPLDWQRHYRVLADLVDADGHLPDIQPGVQFDGDDIGRWIQRQQHPSTWAQLSEEQQRRLSKLGVKPAERPAAAPAAKGDKAPGKASAAFQRGVQALAQYIAREGAQKAVPREHVEPVVIDGQEHEHKLGVWYSNQKQRRDKLTQDQRAQAQVQAQRVDVPGPTRRKPVRLPLSGEDLLRQGRAVVGRMRLVTDERDRALVTGPA